MPLVDWNMTEEGCLNYCYSKGFCWEETGVELYKVLDRVSCWCCGNKNIKELNNMYKYLRPYWVKRYELLKKIKENNNGKGVAVEKAKEQFSKMF